MTIPTIICIAGFKRTGKDTAANFISENYGYQHVKIARAIKELIKYLFMLDEEDVEENKEIVNSEWQVTPRYLMQTIGTELFQFKLSEYMPHIGRNFWIIRFIKQLNDNEKYVVSDLRFSHEFTSLKEKYGEKMIVIRINNTIIVQNDTHVSENEFLQIPADYIVDNNSDIESYLNQIKLILDKLNH
jgi:dephospho-CoA kinase